LLHNSGEMPATLDFVRDCGAAWGVHINWLEYRLISGEHAFEVVSHNSASRAGEPFEAVIKHRGFLPNGRAIFCSGELKTRTIARFIRAERGWTVWKQIIGLRADWADAKRVDKIRLREPRDTELRGVTFPLHEHGITKADVLAFWADQPFDLRLKGPWEGNCDGCFRKRKTAIARMFLDHPHRMEWWPEMESERAGLTKTAQGAVFRDDWKGGYAGVRDLEFDQGRLDLDADDDGMDAFNDCGTGCGI